MAEENKDLNKEIEKLEKFTSKDAVITIAGYSFTPAKLMIAFGIVSSTLGGLYGAFETYKGYQDMKTKIEKYTPFIKCDRAKIKNILLDYFGE